MTARQYVGVVEVGDASIEIYPKLDAALLDVADNSPVPLEASGSVLGNLLWLMEIADGTPAEADTAGLTETPTTFLDLFALLLARNLRAELGRGIPRRYEVWEDDLHTVRGRVRIGEQVARNWNRFDKVACAWDEFTPDIALNRVFRCACRFLHRQVGGAEARRLLGDCLEMLDDVEDISVPAALAVAHGLHHFDRTMERFRLTFDLAARLLAGTGHALQTASAETFVFLVDMNDLFERYVHVLLEARLGVTVRRQQPVWFLLPHLGKGRIAQRPDFYLVDRQQAVWIGDAKYKHLAKAQERSLFFAAVVEDEVGEDVGAAPAGRLLSPDDVRQITVYAELDRLDRLMKGTLSAERRARLMLLYPFVGGGKFEATRTEAWNGSNFALVPVRVTRVDDLSQNLPTMDA
jgi:5-methylcytosine-specific restriction enzyme subunit McrC